MLIPITKSAVSPTTEENLAKREVKVGDRKVCHGG
jgi:hypothetical protein